VRKLVERNGTTIVGIVIHVLPKSFLLKLN
jgi:hypothetical protein